MKSLLKLYVGVTVSLLAVGCSNVDIRGEGIKEFFMYQVHRELISIGKRQLKDEYKEDPSMDCIEYEEQSLQLRSYSRNFQKREMIDSGFFVVDNRGHLKFRIKGSSSDVDDTYDYGIFKTKKDKPLQFGTRLQTNSARIRVEIENFRAYLQTSNTGELSAGLQFVIKL